MKRAASALLILLALGLGTAFVATSLFSPAVANGGNKAGP
jgi:hypothetical protein